MLSALMRSLRQRGIKLWLDGSALKFKAYQDWPIDEETRIQLKENKAEVIAWLKQSPDFFSYFPASENQKSMWLVYCMEPENTAYNLSHAVRLRQDVSVEYLQQAYRLLCQRHLILHTAYCDHDGEILQYVKDDFTPSLDIEDINTLNENELVTKVKQEADKCFNLKTGDVCRAKLLINRRGKVIDTVFQLTVHHIAADFWSCEVLFDELLGIYKDLSGQQQPQYSESKYTDLSHDYFDWCLHQRYLLQSNKLADTKEFWQKSLTSNNACDDSLTSRYENLALTLDYPRPAAQTYQGEELTFHLDKIQSEALRSAAKALGVTPYVFCLSIFQLLLYRYSGQEEFLIGTPTSGRLQQRFGRTVGYLVNPVVLTCDCSGNPRFSDLVKRVADVSKAAFHHQDYPFRSLLEQLNIPRDPSRTPLFQHMFTLTHVHTQQHANMVEATLLSEQRGAAHDLNLVVLDDRETFTGKWRYNRALFSLPTVQGILDNYCHLLKVICEDSHCYINHIALLHTNVEKLEELNRPQKEKVSDLGALDLYEQQVEHYSDASALYYKDKVLTYQQLDDYAHILAHYFQQQGIVQGDCVGLCLPRSNELIVSIFALWKIGAAYAALDPQWPEARIEQLYNDGQLNAIAFLDVNSYEKDRYKVDDLFALQERFEKQGKCIRIASLDSFPKVKNDIPNHIYHQDQPAYFIFTSGSTGKSKAVCVTHRNLAHYISAIDKRLELPSATEANVSLMSLGSLAADLGHTTVFGALLTGRCLHIPTQQQLDDPNLLADYMCRHAINCLKLTPSHLRAFNEVLADILPTHTLILGGEPLVKEQVAQIQGIKPQCRIVNHYGPTEATVGALTYHVNDLTSIKSSVPIGRPLNDTQAYILDKYLNPVPNGVSGELYLGGEGIAQGYVGRSALTAERFVPSPFIHSGQRLYRTGDRARRRHDGEVEYLGRIDQQVKIRGYRIELEEIEYCLRQDEQIADAIVILYFSELNSNSSNSVGSDQDVRNTSNSEGQLLAYIIADATSQQLDTHLLCERIREKLPEAMVPQLWQVLNEFPRLSNGKVDRRNLPLPKSEDRASEEKLLPRTEAEKILYEIWCSVLNREDFGICDSFFELGGDSILSLQIITKARKQGISLTPKVFFEARTVEQLALRATIKKSSQDSSKQHSDKQAAQHSNVLSEELNGKTVPLTPIQQWFFDNQKVNLAHWNQSLLLDVKQTLDPVALRCAVIALVYYHDALRLSYEQHLEGECLEVTQRYQNIADDEIAKCFVHLTYTVESSVPSHKPSYESWRDSHIDQLQKSFQLNSAPLFRIALIEKNKSGAVIALCAHHLLVDGVSWRIILEDLEILYRGFSSKACNNLSHQEIREYVFSALPEKTNSYLEWSNLLHKQSCVSKVQNDIAFWQSLSSSFTQSDYVPGFDINKNTVADAKTERLSLNSDDTEKLLGPALAAYNVHVNEFLLAALVPVLSVLFENQVLADEALKNEQPWIPVELEGHGRDNPLSDDDIVDVSRTVGWFTSRYPVAINSIFDDWDAAFLQVKAALRNVPNNGLTYGINRYLNKNIVATQQFSPVNLITLNYLGQFDQSFSSSDIFALNRNEVANTRSQDSTRTHVIDLTMQVLNGELHIAWTYPAHCIDSAYMQDIANRYLTSLSDLLQHCLGRDEVSVDASDFDDADISQDEFDLLLQELD
ncbi:non-ribosomal peptide synthetase [Agarilytica rhodophyticola]|uniref:non-ribosomal peptide synthetase n=1 Tax=Agarilytica rhodophyticola TaxID=1737490 RepID=UPI00131A132B|nr:non-ribosomal peptide synthetase [Agarilytica rhodophyticola]